MEKSRTVAKSRSRRAYQIDYIGHAPRNRIERRSHRDYVPTFVPALRDAIRMANYARMIEKRKKREACHA